MQSNKSNALWVSNKYEQGVGETDWKQYAALMTTPQTTSNNSLFSATTSALTLGSTSLPVMLEESGGTKTLFSDSSKLTSTNAPDVTTGTVSTSHSFSNIYSFGFLVTPDGTQVGIWNYSANQLQVYAMSTPYDLTTASNTNNISINDASASSDVRFNSNGTKVFAPYGTSQSYVYEYPLSTAYDLSTLGSGSVLYTNSRNPDYALAVSDSSWFFSDWSYGAGLFEQGSNTMITLPDGTSSNIRSLYFEANGSVLYALRDNGILYQYSLSTPYDPSTASYNNLSLNIGGTISTPTSIQTAGGYLYIQKQPTNSTLYRISGDFSTSYVYDISSLSLSSAPTKAYQLPSCAVALGGNEIATNAYPTPHAAVSSSTTSVTMGYNTSTDPVIAANDPIDVVFIKSAGTNNAGTKTQSSSNTLSSYTLTTVSDDGAYAYARTGGSFYRYPLSTNFDITTAGSSDQNYYSGSSYGTQFLTYDGRHLVVYYYNNRYFYIYSLSTPYVITSTKTQVGSYIDASSQISTSYSNPQIFLTDDLSHVYIGSNLNSVNTIYHYVNGAFSDSLQTNAYGSQNGGHDGLAISADGLTLYGSNNSNSGSGAIYEYALKAPYSLADATLTGTITVSSASVTAWRGIALNPATYTRLYFNSDTSSGYRQGQYTSSGRFGGKAFSTTASTINLSGSNTVITFPQQDYAPDGLTMPDTSTAANFTGFTTSGSNWIIESDKVTLPGSDTGRYIQYKIEAPNSGMTTSNLQLNLWKLP